MIRNNIIEETIEAICEKGCQAVRDDIAILNSGKKPADTGNLNHEERKLVYKELTSIMAIYGDTCNADGEVKTPQSPELMNEY